MTKRSIKKEKYSLHIELPQNVRTVIGELKKRGFEAYAVGGCVRDSILGREPGDWDITTSALPADIKAAFRHTVDTGIEHGTVTVLIGGGSYEVTTYRIDGEYRDQRHPSSVTFTDKLAEDLRRRDFTINAMAYNEDKGLVDLFDGREDLKHGIIRCVGNADERFDEDALRILRAVRFAAQLDFDIDAATRDAISTHAPNLKAVSKERIMTELSKLICSAHIEKTADIFQLGIVPYIAKHFREINIAQLMELKAAAIRAAAGMAHIESEAGDTQPAVSMVQIEDEASGSANVRAQLSDEAAALENNVRAAQAAADMAQTEDETAQAAAVNEEDEALLPEAAFELTSAVPVKYRYIRFAILCEGMDAGNVDAMLKDLKADNITRRNAAKLAGYILSPMEADAYKMKSIMSAMEPELFMALLRIKLISSQSMLYKRFCADEDICALLELFNHIAVNEEPVYMTDLAVSGDDLKAAGAAEGPAMGRTLHAMLNEVWREPSHNTREWLMENMLKAET